MFSGKSPDFPSVFGKDYTRAQEFMKTNGTYFEMVSKRFGNDPRFLKGIVFPELIRYSQFSDLLETGTLEWLYVEGGSKAADFSIGHFQMKPSFVETLEGFVSSEESLKEEYGFLVLNGSGSSFRKTRIDRMKDQAWQFVYLSCFFDCALKKFATEKWSSDEDKLRFIATVYNAGLHLSKDEIQKLIFFPSFPYGTKFSAQDQYAYSDVAVDYFQRLTISNP